METRRLGQTSISVPRLSLGCVTFGREIDEPTSFAILDRAIGAGVALLDTAEAYGRGASEEIVGRWLAARPGMRNRVILQTKVTPPLTRQRILDSLDASLRRLQTDYVDLFLLHAFDATVPLEESLAALDEAVRAGKVRHTGCSNFTVGQLSKSDTPRLEVIQFNYNLAIRDAEAELIPLCREKGIGVQTYSPLGAGFLTGKYDAGTRAVPAGSRFDIIPGHTNIYFHDEKFAAARRLASLSRRTGIPIPELAIAWVLANPAIDTVLVGARKVAHVDSALAASLLPFDPAWSREVAGG